MISCQGQSILPCGTRTTYAANGEAGVGEQIFPRSVERPIYDLGALHFLRSKYRMYCCPGKADLWPYLSNADQGSVKSVAIFVPSSLDD